MAYGFTAQANNAIGASGVGITASFTVSPGDTAIVVWLAYTGVVTTSPLSDGTHTYTNSAGGGTVTSTLTHRMAMFYVASPTPGSYTLTVTLGGARSNRRLAVATYNGTTAFQTAGTLDQLAASTATDAVTTASLTPSSQPAMLAALSLTANGTATYSAGTGHTSRGALSNWDALGLGSTLLEDIRLTSTSATPATFTIGTSRDTLSSGLIFTEAASASSVTGAGGIASAEAIGSPNVAWRSQIAPSGIASAEAFGSPTVARTAQAAVAPAGIPSAEAFGTPALSFRTSIAPTGIASAEAFGIATFVRDGAAPAARLNRGGLGLRLFLGV